MSVDIAAIRAVAEKAGHYSVSWSVPDRDYRFDKSVPVGDFAQLDNDDVEQGQGETLARYIAKLDPQTVLALCDLAERTIERQGIASTHWEDCWQAHDACAAALYRKEQS